jgi:MIP family channel proteins
MECVYPCDETGRMITHRKPWQRYLAEFIGTFVIVFGGCGAIISNASSQGTVSHVGISLAFGFAVLTMIYTLGPISAAHFNPAVTLGFATAGRFPWKHVPAYWLAQSLGALLASLCHKFFYLSSAVKDAAYGATSPASGISLGSAAAVEVILTFILMLVIMAMATDRRVPGAVPGLAIGLTVALCALFAGPVTGASMNPARSLAPAALARGTSLNVLWIYIVSPLVGAVLAGRCFEVLRDGAVHAQSAPADLDDAMHREPGLSRKSESSGSRFS